MTRSVEFFFDVGSPTAYLAWTQLPTLCRQEGADLVLRPMLLGGVFQATGNVSPVTVPAKGRYMNVDIARHASRYGVPLAISQEFYHVGIAPNELTDAGSAGRLISRQLGVPLSVLSRNLRSGKRWVYYHGPFSATQVQSLRRVSGIHLSQDYQRFYPSRMLARPIIGGLSGERESGAAGLELSLDSILTGTPGEAVLLKDRAGRRYDSPARVIREPVAGNDVVLTIDAELQEIAERGLDDALSKMDAEGGDVVFLDPNNGELLALASRQGGRRSGYTSSRASTFTDPFEPGSTAISRRGSSSTPYRLR